MKCLMGMVIGLVAIWAFPVAPARAEADPPQTKPPEQSGRWPTERVQLRGGQEYHGLIESEDDSWLHLTEIQQLPGKPTHLVIRTIDRASVASVKRLEPQQRARLQHRIEQWVNRARIESGRMDAVQLRVVDRDRDRFQHYRGKWFDLDSTADEESTRRLIVRIEQMFTAYRQILSPRTDARSRLRLVILGSLEQYRAYLARYGLNVDNPAVYIPERNLVIAGSELARYTAELAKVKVQHDGVRQELAGLEKKLRERLVEMGKQLQAQGAPRSEIARLLNQARRETESEIKSRQNLLRSYDRENDEAFDKVTRRMFTRLYHEAFHAYLENYVYPHDRYDVPVWLNEGLAVIFESGILESDTLRIDAPNAAALKRLRDEIRTRGPMPLAELLSAGPEHFFAAPRNPAADPDRYYAYAWGLVYYLAFERHVLGTSALDAYVDRSSKDVPPVGRLETLVGTPAGKLQSAWREYILALK